MKKWIIIILAVIILPINAKKYVSGEPWPRKGYKLIWVTPSGYHPLEVQQFTGTNLYYLKLKPIGLKDGEFYFLTINHEVADSILRYTLTNEYFPSKLQRRHWLKSVLDSTGVKKPITETEWTLYKPQRIYSYHIDHTSKNYWKPFDVQQAWQYYCKQRNLNPKTGAAKQQLSTESSLVFLQMIRAILPVMAAGADNRTLTEKVMNGGY